MWKKCFSIRQSIHTFEGTVSSAYSIKLIKDNLGACGVGKFFANSDNNIMRFALDNKRNFRKNCFWFRILTANLTDLKKELGTVNWNHMVNVTGIDEVYSKFRSQLIASKPRRTDNHKPLWMTNYLQKINTSKIKAHKKYRSTQYTHDSNNYINLKLNAKRWSESKKCEYKMTPLLQAKNYLMFSVA